MATIPVDGNKILSIRKRRLRISREHLAARLGISERQLLNIELLKTRAVNQNTFEALCNHLGVGAVAIQPREQRQFVSVGKLPTVGGALAGREQRCAELDAAWTNQSIRVVCLIAGPGVGKTALAINWWHHNQVHDADYVLGWSFYSQGAGEDRQESAEPFVDYALRSWFGVSQLPGDSWQKGMLLANCIREQRTLLMLDGLESIQHPPGERSGQFKDRCMLALLKELAAQSEGLSIYTSRSPLSDLTDYAPRGVLNIDLENLSPEASIEYLKSLGVVGEEEELSAASQEFGYHALALTLLGTLLAKKCNGEIRKRDTLPPLSSDQKYGGHTRRIYRRYEELFAGRRELDVLRMIGLVDRPLDNDAVRALQAIAWDDWVEALENLRDARLVDYSSPMSEIDCHPLTREHFALEYRTSEPEHFRAAHRQLFQHYSAKQTSPPDTLEGMQPLFRAIYHGCCGDFHRQACISPYRDRIQRGDDYYLMRNLGALASNLTVLANFFDTPWKLPSKRLTEQQQAESLSEASFCLRAAGRLAEAIEPLQESIDRHFKNRDIREAARSSGNFAELQLSLGYIAEAIDTSRKAIVAADDSDNVFESLKQRTKLANALHQSGELHEAQQLFEQAEAMQQEWKPECRYLYGYRGYQYCDLLMSLGQLDEARARAATNLELVERPNGTLLTIALCVLVLGRLDTAVTGIEKSGYLEDLPRALLARGTQSDLEEVKILATRSGMRLFLADYHLVMASKRASRSKGLARAHVEKAAYIIITTGYHRRDGDMNRMRAFLGEASNIRKVTSAR